LTLEVWVWNGSSEVQAWEIKLLLGLAVRMPILSQKAGRNGRYKTCPAMFALGFVEAARTLGGQFFGSSRITGTHRS
jgi:hypothetical protein